MLLAACAAIPIIVMSFSRGGSSSRSGELVVESEPRGARVQFVGIGAEELNLRYDGRGYRTPFTISEGVPVGVGLHARFIKDGYDVVDRDLSGIKPGMVPEPLFAELRLSVDQAKSATLVVISSPPGADAFVDGNKLEGKTPLSDVRVRGGESHHIEVRLQGYLPAAENRYAEPGARVFSELNLSPVPKETLAAAQKPPKPEPSPPPAPTPAAVPDKTPPRPSAPPVASERTSLSVTSPLKLRVTLDGHAVGETPLRKLAVEPGLTGCGLRVTPRGS